MNDKIRYFFPKVKNRIPGILAKFSEYLPIERISTKGIDSIFSKAELVTRLKRILGANLSDIICSASIEDRRAILIHADEAKQHIFRILGSVPVKMEPINWSREIKTDYVWPVGVYYLKIRSLTPKGTDIKVPWEISRCHHLLWMAEAYCLTGDESYAEEVVNQIQHWITHNPFMYSVNWTCAMEVSIRAVNWMYSLVLIASSLSFTDIFARKVYSSLYQHLFFINRNLEKCIPYSNNHYFSDLVGMLFLGQLFFTTRYGKRSFKYAVKEYVNEVKKQIFPSGVDYERSISYHRLMTELVLYPYYMLKRTGYEIPNVISDRLSRMLGYINQYTMGNGCSPMVSDNDDGRFIPWVPMSFMDHSYLVKFESLDSQLASTECQWITPAYESNTSCMHEDANLAILKKDGMYVFISCFHRWRYDYLTNRFTSTHLHNDLLSFVFADEKTQIIADAGAYCYTSDIETWKSFRTAKKHNTIIVDDEEPNILGNATFMMKYNSNAKPMLFSYSDIEHCEGEYTTIEGGMTHHRCIDLGSMFVKITDHLSKKNAGHKAYMSFHFAEDVDAIIDGKGVISLFACGKEYTMSISSKSSLEMYIVNDTLSPSFGVLVNTKTLIVEFIFDEEAECVTTIKKI